MSYLIAGSLVLGGYLTYSQLYSKTFQDGVEIGQRTNAMRVNTLPRHMIGRHYQPANVPALHRPPIKTWQGDTARRMNAESDAMHGPSVYTL